MKLRTELRRRIQSRIRVGRIKRDQRRTARDTFAFFKRLWPSVSARVLLTSSLEWTSELRTLSGTDIVILDLEQVNAISYQVWRGFAHEHPIVHYNEFAIRSCELMLSAGLPHKALALAAANEARLRDYSRTEYDGRALLRPFIPSLHERAIGILESNVVLAFVLGHELGHSLADSEESSCKPHLDRIEQLWRSVAFEKAAPEIRAALGRRQGPQFPRFVTPAVWTKLGHDGHPNGHIISGSQLAKNSRLIEANFIDESKADFFGLLCATNIAIKSGLTPDELLQVFLLMQEALDRNAILRVLCNSLPTRPEQRLIRTGISRAPSRMFMLGAIIRELRDGRLNLDPDIGRFWRQLSPRAWRQIKNVRATAKLANVAERASIVALGALHLGAGGEFPANIPSKEEIMRRFHLAAGNYLATLKPFMVPQEIYDLSTISDWTPSNDLDPATVGFATAVRDMVQVMLYSTSAQGEVESAAGLVDRVRQSRIWINTFQIGALGDAQVPALN